MITKDMTVGEIVNTYPKAAEILMSFGMGCLGCPSATMESLQQACIVHGLELEKVLENGGKGQVNVALEVLEKLNNM